MMPVISLSMLQDKPKRDKKPEFMKLLAIDSATEACSAALWLDGEIISRYELAPRRHTELLLPMVDSLLQETSLQFAALDALAFGRGPGSFTGVRIATACVQGLAWAARLPVVPVSTLAAIAQATIRKRDAEAVACAIDARMSEVYWGCYVRNPSGLASLVGEEIVIAPDRIPTGGVQDWYAAGTGWGVYKAAMLERFGSAPLEVDEACLPDARDIATLAVEGFKLGQAVRAEEALPVYLRNKVTHQTARQPKK